MEPAGLEGRRKVRAGIDLLKPPFPAVEGYLKCPTVVNNVETLAVVPWVIRNGAAAYAKLTTAALNQLVQDQELMEICHDKQA